MIQILLVTTTSGIALQAKPAQAIEAPELPTTSQSVYNINPILDGSLIVATAATSAVAYTFSDRLIHPTCPCNRDDVNAFDRGVIGNQNDFLGRVSDVTVVAAMAFPAILDWRDVGVSKEFVEDMTVYFEALSMNGALVTLAKYSVQRPLPRTYAGDPSLINSPGGYRSFYSGHTSVTLSSLTTAAMTYSYRHHDRYWPWIVTGVTGLSVAAERVADGRHFYSDVIVGALAGAAVGYAVPHFHHRKDGTGLSVGVLPVEDGVVALAKFNY